MRTKFFETRRFMSATATSVAVLFLAQGLAATHASVFAIKQEPRAHAVAQLDILGSNRDGEAFVRAVSTRHKPLIDLFLAAGADVNAPDSEGRTALLVASFGKDWELVKTLLAHRADVGCPDANGRTPLMGAAFHGNVSLLRELLSRGADPAAADEAGHTALHYAVAAKHFEAFQALLSLRTDAADECCGDQTVLTHAFATRDWRFVEPLLANHPATLQWSQQSRAWLAEALNARDVKTVRLLLAKHPAPPTPEGRAQPLLAYAVAQDNLQLFQLLLDCGADPNTGLGTPASEDFLALLPKIPVRHYVQDEPGMNVLMLAAGLGKPEYVQLLLDKGANRSAATHSKHKLVPLYFAAWAKSADAIRLLVGNAPPPEKVRIEISLSDQRATLFKDGANVLSTAISSGRPGFSTPSGTFVVTDKKRDHISSIYKVKMPFFMRLNCRDFGLHQGHIPGHPASHGCIRLPSDAARRLFSEVPIGTLVTIR